ncbi:hypothetical protein EBESD8_30850 [Rhodococcus aetherivorans]|nr:hypothetical protein EBESD8_30850 [Rhodococcus aetherivorans]
MYVSHEAPPAPEPAATAVAPASAAARHEVRGTVDHLSERTATP